MTSSSFELNTRHFTLARLSSASPPFRTVAPAPGLCPWATGDLKPSPGIAPGLAAWLPRGR
ncbi:MAG: hypothetical protein F6J95_023445 [Leptolyngbya sp. SIO1E4]|nr:hypothetical protein [Leptolyngbya sp. SIO1E4]